jgi:protein tyrosine/serine phosphatase
VLSHFRPGVLLFAAASVWGQTQAPTPGLRNFHQVNEHIYRGAQPAVWGYKTLASMGIKTIIDLRGEGIAEGIEKKLAKDQGISVISFPLDGHRAPSADQIAKLLKLLDDESKWPLLIHCRRGADRTGTVVACYRITHDKWDNQKALDEAMSYTMDPGQKLMRQFILQFQASTPTLSAPAPTAASK